MNPKPDLLQKDVVIIGAGPAGLSALLWCADLGLDAAIVEQRLEPGGQLLAIHNPITNYLGLKTQNGREMRDLFVKHAGDNLKSQFLGISAATIDVQTKAVQLSDGRVILSKAVVLATGVRRRRLGIEGEAEFQGKGILDSGAKEKESVKGKRVVIVGGGDAALENASILGEYASGVTIVHRRGTFSARPEFVSAAEHDTRVAIIYNARPVRIDGSDHVEAVEIQTTDNGHTRSIPADAVLIRIGVEPNSELLKGQVSEDARGYILTGRECQTDVPGVYAVGDVANPLAPTISTAAGSGAAAAKSIYTLIKGR